MKEIKVYNVNPTKLINEIIASGNKVLNNEWEGLDENTCTVSKMTIYFDDDIDTESLERIIDQHNPEIEQSEELSLEDYLLDLDFRVSMLELGL